PDQLELGSKTVFFPLGYVQQDVSHEVNLAALPGHTGKGTLNRRNQAGMGIRDDERHPAQAALLESGEELGITVPGFFEHRLDGQHVALAAFTDSADEQDGHADDP